MRSWTHPVVPDLSAHGTGTPPRVFDSSRRALTVIEPDSGASSTSDSRFAAAESTGAGAGAGAAEAREVGLYVCGITPYDATHMGHAATYVTFDVLHRVLLDAGRQVHYVQNVTDVDDPLLERAKRDGIDWVALAQREIQLFRDDMEALAVIPPAQYLGVVESIESIAQGVLALLANGSAYEVAAPDALVDGAADIYLDLTSKPSFGSVSRFDRAEMLAVYADRGGDPERPGKRDALDPLLWRAARADEPSWAAPGLPDGRPGWHIECTCIAVDHLGTTFDVQGGGVDLVFPHHEMSAVQAEGLYGPGAFARVYVHQEMVGLDGEKMSKSKGNLVLVSKLRREGVDPMAVRLVLLDHHYRTPWSWTDESLAAAQQRLATWREGVEQVSTDQATRLLADLRALLADDLDTPAALAAVDACMLARDGDGTGAQQARDSVAALLGIAL
ncbi:L-cysteine:1D-myo-inositol 2-amino-2-deoxy-alpha-D-glucopyranoside ligase [Kineosphaera limosa]|uniref:cysteine--1-D-myo-inosityl 2-amino-2-deoxy-alpha-D-glucopyranoside ligase n=1 Tax=Kineosphaera limosa TaxID=111564 RepID=UPI00058B87D3|nr:cysteine--1-D-myo-inosityl 2-amino-2-deoxy-alpha-D-glucopyranoside ligase [Kineosphaera limosa]NYE03198.1 L-cysteine:1D-myo-inositol 2-amino-2-deoxy-alpha-D-glucopyranoside ligase [Kineosphaera limosa]